MLPVCDSLRELEELDSSARDFESQPRPRRVFSRCSKRTVTKEVAGWICLASFCACTVFLEYQMRLLCGAAFVVCAAACALAVISSALHRAPEADERADGLHVRPRKPRGLSPLALSAASGRLHELRPPLSLENLRHQQNDF